MRLRPFGPPRRLALALVLTGAATAACSSSSVPSIPPSVGLPGPSSSSTAAPSPKSSPSQSPTSVPTTAPTTAPTPTPLPIPAAGLSASLTLQTSTSGTTTFPAVGSSGFTSAVTLPQGDGPVQVTETVTSGNPGPVIASVRRAAASRTLATGSGISPLLYVQFSAAAPVTLTGAPTFTFALPVIPSQYSYGLAAFDPTFGTWNLGYAQATIGGQLTFPGPVGTLLVTPTLKPIFALIAYQGPAPTPAPSSTPQITVGSTPIPVPSPTGTGVGVGSSPIPIPSPTTTGVSVGSSPLPLPT